MHIIGVISYCMLMLKTSRAIATERGEITMPGSGVDKKVWKRKVDRCDTICCFHIVYLFFILLASFFGVE